MSDLPVNLTLAALITVCGIIGFAELFGTPGQCGAPIVHPAAAQWRAA